MERQTAWVPGAGLVHWRTHPAVDGPVAARSGDCRTAHAPRRLHDSARRRRCHGVAPPCVAVVRAHLRIVRAMYLEERRRIVWRHVIGPLALFTCVLLVYSTGSAFAAHQGHGHYGAWTATRLQCSHRGCQETGDFRSTDGTDNRAGVGLAATPTVPVGSTFAAVDSGGDEVYPPGFPGWWHNLVWAAALGLVGVAWLWTVPLRLLRQRGASRAVDQDVVPSSAAEPSWPPPGRPE